jgi:phosphate transport system substrate-binding protein
LLLGAGAAALSLTGRPARAQAGSVVGAGSSLARPVYQKWAELAAAGANLRVTYEGVGSTVGLDRLKSRSVDFASADFAQRGALVREHQLIQFPVVIAGVMPFVNLPGVADGQLRLTGELLADIFLGKITKWNDAKIKAQNSALNLPATNIVPVHRVEPSGANMLFTTYLTRVSEAWAAGPRAGTTVQWPQGKGAEVDGLDALAAKVKGTPGAIGYGGVTTVKTNAFASVTLQNRAGEFVKADHASFAKAAEAEDWNTPGFNVDLVDEAASGAWPILGAAFVLVPENPSAEKVEAARSTFKFFDWAFDHGFAAAHELGYEGIPKTAIPAVETVWRRSKDPSGRPIWEA